MGDRQSNRRIGAAYVAALFMTLIVVLAFLLKRYQIDLAVTYAIIVIAPLVIYLVLSGDVSEIAGPGGISAKFKADARAPVETSAEIEALEVVAKSIMPGPLDRSRQFRPGAPIALTLKLQDPGAGYDWFAVRDYVTALSDIDPDLTVIFVTTDGVFRASTDGMAIKSVIANDHLGQRLEQALVSGDLSQLKTLVPVSEKAVERAESNAAALKRMNETGVKSLVAIDQTGRPVGVVRRDRIVAKLVESLAGG